MDCYNNSLDDLTAIQEHYLGKKLKVIQAPLWSLSTQINPNSDTIYKLKKFVNMIVDYQESMNLIGKSTIPDIWTRHVLDSAQIEKFLPKEIIYRKKMGFGIPIN